MLQRIVFLLTFLSDIESREMNLPSEYVGGNKEFPEIVLAVEYLYALSLEPPMSSSFRLLRTNKGINVSHLVIFRYLIQFGNFHMITPVGNSN